MTRSELLEVVYRFYPRDLWVDSPGYDETPERHRRVTAARRGASEYPTWQAMLGRLRLRYWIHDLSLHILGGSVDCAYAVQLGVRAAEAEEAACPDRPGFRLSSGCCVSLLGPYYVVLPAGSPDEAPRDLAREIEATYRGYQPIPPEIGTVVVPDVALDDRALGRATVYDCLLSTWPWLPLRPQRG